eukprot:s1495_g10.t1
MGPFSIQSPFRSSHEDCSFSSPFQTRRIRRLIQPPHGRSCCAAVPALASNQHVKHGEILIVCIFKLVEPVFFSAGYTAELNPIRVLNT